MRNRHSLSLNSVVYYFPSKYAQEVCLIFSSGQDGGFPFSEVSLPAYCMLSCCLAETYLTQNNKVIFLIFLCFWQAADNGGEIKSEKVFDKKWQLEYDKFNIKVRSQKNRLKKPVFRIFRKLLAKTTSGSRINTGFFEGYRRNGVSPSQGIDTFPD